MQGLNVFQQILWAGVTATAVLDLWQWLLRWAFGVPATNWALVGRWVSHIPEGRLFHSAIGCARPMPLEAAIGWLTHYAVGLIYAATYLVLMPIFTGTGPTFVSALGFGIITVMAPWFLLQPGMGLGVCGRKAARPALTRLHSLSSHAAFGAGLYLGILAFTPGVRS